MSKNITASSARKIALANHGHTMVPLFFGDISALVDISAVFASPGVGGLGAPLGTGDTVS